MENYTCNQCKQVFPIEKPLKQFISLQCDKNGHKLIYLTDYNLRVEKTTPTLVK